MFQNIVIMTFFTDCCAWNVFFTGESECFYNIWTWFILANIAFLKTDISKRHFAEIIAWPKDRFPKNQLSEFKERKRLWMNICLFFVVVFFVFCFFFGIFFFVEIFFCFILVILFYCILFFFYYIPSTQWIFHTVWQTKSAKRFIHKEATRN